jgi:hypothetical protein
MPQVPRRTEREIVPRPRPNINVQGRIPLEAPQRDVADLVSQVGTQLIGTVEKIATREQEINDRLKQQAFKEVDDAIMMGVDTDSFLLKESVENSVSNYRGKHSLDSREFATGMWDDGEQGILKGLKTEYQKRRAKLILGKRKVETMVNVERHITKEMNEYTRQAPKLANEAALKDAIKNFRRPGKYQEFKAYIRGNFDYMVDKKEIGMDPLEADKQYSAMVAEFHTEVMKRLNSDGKYGEAVKWGNYFKSIGEADDDSFAQLEKARKEVEKAAEKVRAENMARLDERMATGGVTHRQLDVLWDNQENAGGPRFFKDYSGVVKAKNFLNENFDGPLPPEDKRKRLVLIADAFSQLKDAEYGGPEYQKFRDLLIASKEYLTPRQYNYFVKYTGELQASELAARTALWKRFIDKYNAVQQESPGSGMWAFMAGVYAVFNPEANYEQVRKETDEIILRYQANENTDALLYKPGDTKDFGPPLGIGTFDRIDERGKAIWDFKDLK